MERFFENVFSGIGITDIVDILIVAFVIYKLLGLIKQTRAEQLLKGVLVLVVATFVTDLMNLHTINWLLKGTVALGAVAITGGVSAGAAGVRWNIWVASQLMKGSFSQMDKEKGKHITTQIIRAIENFSANRVGALMVFEKETSLMDIIETGTVIDAEISDQLLGNIFYEGAPLHDGALIIRQDRAYAAGCVLPLTHDKSISKDLGTRHRAGIGITENSDALVLIVSEETGAISMASEGKLTRFLDIKTVEKMLLNMYWNNEPKKASIAFIPKTINKIRGKNHAGK